jgi:alpha-beta hydrolase superfamily lysophospholipase
MAAGFRSIAESCQFVSPTGTSTGDLATVIATRNAATPIRSISILGHSLGGALATLAAAQIAFSNPGLPAGIEFWTYASPRVALPDFMTAFSEAVPNAYRIWNTLDIVPQVPTFPYTHVGQSEELKQSQAQIEKLKALPACEHHLTTYQWLLDPSTTSPDTACQITAPAAVLHEGISPLTGARLAPVSEEAIGAAALAQALRRHP